MKLYRVDILPAMEGLGPESGQVPIPDHEVLIDTGETFVSVVDFKKKANLNPDKYAGQVLELHPENITRLEPETQTRLKF